MAQQPDDIIVIQKIQKILSSSYQNIGDTMISGGVDNMDKYKYLLGQAHAYQYIIQEISNLLDNKEHKSYDDGNVIDIGKEKGSTKD